MSFSDKIIRRLARITTSGRYIPEIDGLRFLSILSVILFHIYLYVKGTVIRFTATPENNILIQMFNNGNVGVSLFFVISGFVIALPFVSHYLNQDPRVELKHYYLRRLTRIEPPYFICMVLFFVLAALHAKYPFKELLLNLGASLAYLQNAIYNKMSLLNPVAWSLEVEVQFYVLAPLLCTIFRLQKRLRRGILSGLMIAFGLLQTQFHNLLFGSMTLPGQIQYFLAGLLLADFYLTELNPGRYGNKLWDFIGVVSMITIFILGRRPEISRFILPFLILTLSYAALKGHLVRRFFSSPLVRTIGGMCYSIYLLHYGIIFWMGPCADYFLISQYAAINFSLIILVFVSAILLISTLYFILIEKPCMNPKWPKILSEKFRFTFAA